MKKIITFLKNNYKKILILLAIVLIIVVVIFFFKSNKIINFCNKNTDKNYYKNNPVATMNIKDYGTVKIELYPNIAPNTVKNFIALANNKYYDGLKFDRIEKDFLIQCGGYYENIEGYNPKTKMYEVTDKIEYMPFLSDIRSDISWKDANDKEYSIKGEFSENGYNNTLSHKEGVISMARYDYSLLDRTEDGYNTAGAQFFILTKDMPDLDGLYASFGKVTEGMDIIHEIENNGKDSITISSIKVDTFGEEYGLPDTINFISVSDITNENCNLDNSEKRTNVRLKAKLEKEDKEKFLENIKNKMISISKRYNYKYLSSSIWKTLSNGDYVVLLSMSDSRYARAYYYQLIEIDPNSNETINASGLFNSDQRSIVEAEYIEVWGYNN